MRKNVVLFALFLFVLLLSCSTNELEVLPEIKDLKLEQYDLSLLKDKSSSVKIVSGNGEYIVKSTNENVVKATVSDDVITITSVTTEDRAEAAVIVTDRYFERVGISVRVSKEFNLVADKSSVNLELGVEGHEETEIFIKEGNLDYIIEVVEGSDFIEIETSQLKERSRFVIKAKVEGESKVKITDGLSKTFYVDVNIDKPQEVVTDIASVSFDGLQQIKKVKVLSGSPDYEIEVDNPMILFAKIEGDDLLLTSYMNGKTKVFVKDSKGQLSQPIIVTIDSPQNALNLGADYFCHADFSEIAAVDRSIKNCKQVTFEMLCKITGYRGSQTFMGLEKNLIIRGKHDDYRETHPLEIIGLDGRLSLESTSSFNLNEWTHIALVVDCDKSDINSKYKLYINGVQDDLKVNRNDQSHSSIDLVSSSDDNRFEIGRASGFDWTAIRGVVAESRVWITARTQSQISDNMYALKDVSPNGLLANWLFSSHEDTNYIQDTNGGRYSTNLTISEVKGSFVPVNVAKSKFVEFDFVK